MKQLSIDLVKKITQAVDDDAERLKTIFGRVIDSETMLDRVATIVVNDGEIYKYAIRRHSNV